VKQKIAEIRQNYLEQKAANKATVLQNLNKTRVQPEQQQPYHDGQDRLRDRNYDILELLGLVLLRFCSPVAFLAAFCSKYFCLISAIFCFTSSEADDLLFSVFFGTWGVLLRTHSRRVKQES
jgi:hypothetical protein